MKRTMIKQNLGLIISSIITLIFMGLYIAFVRSAKYYASIEIHGKHVNSDHLPFGVINTSEFVTDANNYTSLTWILAFFVLIFMTVFAHIAMKKADVFVIDYFADKVDDVEKIIKIERFLFTLVSTLLFVETLRSGFYAALQADVVSGSIIYGLIFIAYFIIRNPAVWVVALAFLAAPIIAPYQNLSLEERIDHDLQEREKARQRARARNMDLF